MNDAFEAEDIGLLLVGLDGHITSQVGWHDLVGIGVINSVGAYYTFIYRCLRGFWRGFLGLFCGGQGGFVAFEVGVSVGIVDVFFGATGGWLCDELAAAAEAR